MTDYYLPRADPEVRIYLGTIKTKANLARLLRHFSMHSWSCS